MRVIFACFCMCNVLYVCVMQCESLCVCLVTLYMVDLHVRVCVLNIFMFVMGSG